MCCTPAHVPHHKAIYYMVSILRSDKVVSYFIGTEPGLIDHFQAPGFVYACKRGDVEMTSMERMARHGELTQLKDLKRNMNKQERKKKTGQSGYC
jgi:hypothetical protein